MGGTSFDAALVVDGPVTVNDGEIGRHRIALPMLPIHTIGAGGGYIGWIDGGGLPRMGPESAGADPGPACYGKGGTLPTATDAALVLGYLDADFFAGGKIRLDAAAARRAIAEHMAAPLGVPVEEAAAGMYRIICTNMAQGVREVTIERGFDPREFPMVVAGGAGPIHACMISQELDLPLLVVPRESSIFCAAGMLISDLKHDFVRTFVAPLAGIDGARLARLVDEMVAEGTALLDEEKVPEERRRHEVRLDCRYVKQYHEVSFAVPRQAIAGGDTDAIAGAFHAEHERLYGYSLEEQAAPVESINVRVQATGVTEKPDYAEDAWAGQDPAAALKGERRLYVPEDAAFRTVPVYDGHRTRFGHRIAGPAMIEQVNTALFVGASFDCVCDRLGSFAVYRRGRQDMVAETLEHPP